MTASSKPPFAGEVRCVRLGELISPAKVEKCGRRILPILSITKDEGIVLQKEKFKKRVASADVSGYKVVPKGKLVQGIHIDEANFAIQNLVDYGVVSPAYKVWDVDDSLVMPEYLAAVLRSSRCISYYRKMLSGTVHRRGRISNELFYKLDVPLPSLLKQEESLKMLGSVQRYLVIARRQLSLFDELVKSRFVEMFESTEWPTFPAGSVLLNMRNGVSPSKEGLCHARVLTLSAITQGSFDAESWKEGAYPSDPPREKRVSAGEFYICRGNGNRDLVGAGEYSDTDLPGLVFPDTMIAARINFDLISAAYLRYAWGRPAIRRQIESRARTTNGTFKINQRMLSEVLLPLPPLSLQREFAAFAAEVAKSQVAVRQQIERFQTFYDSLAQEYFG